MSSSSPAVAKAVKRVSKKTDSPSTVEVVTTVVATPAVVVAAEASKAKAPRKAAVKASEPVVVAPVVAAVASTDATTATAVVVERSLAEDVKSLLSSLQSLREVASGLITETKKLEKRVPKALKEASKRKRRVTVNADGTEVKRAPSVFEVPQNLTSDLCVFLGHPVGTKLSRSNVTKQVNEYVKAHNLKDKHTINPDASLRKLLEVPTTEVLSYFNLQKYLNKHYVKVVASS